MSVRSPSGLALQVAAASRALAVAGLFDMHGHVSVREGDIAYVNAHSASRIAIRPDEVATVRIADGATLGGTPPSELPIHLEIYRARGDVGAVVHFHALYATALAYLLARLETERLILTGQVTEQCILYTALDAYVRHFQVVIPTDAVAHIDGDLAAAALKMMEQNMSAELTTAADCLG